MDINVIIPAYNEENSIGEVIEEIRRVTNDHSGNCELIVVNDDSTDKTEEVVKLSRAELIEHPGRDL